MNYIDKNLKNEIQENTIGIIICKKNNYFVLEYVSDDRVFETEYKVVWLVKKNMLKTKLKYV